MLAGMSTNRIKEPIAPRGDGNSVKTGLYSTVVTLRNPLPREGTETLKNKLYQFFRILIKEPIAPRGDGNLLVALTAATLALLRNPLPREGTETSSNSTSTKFSSN